MHRIGIAAKPEDKALNVAREVSDWLTVLKKQVFLEEGTAKLLGVKESLFSKHDLTPPPLDLIVVIGGDGSMLAVARQASLWQIPIIGINGGRLGFLTETQPEHFRAALTQIFNDNYQIEERFLLEYSVLRNNTPVFSGNALNDVVVARGAIGRLLNLSVAIDHENVSGIDADGIIACTPTGSTGYALSAGGPILHPHIPALALIPLCAHTLTNRPIVVPNYSEVSLTINTTCTTEPHLTADGQVHFTLNPGDVVNIKKQAKTVQLIQVNGSYYKTLRTKLKWGH